MPMSKLQNFALFILRTVMGWMFLNAGINHFLDKKFSGAGYVSGAKSFVWLYQLFLNPQVLPIVDSLVKYGLVLLGVSLVIGLFVRLSSYLGMLLMFLFYLPTLNFPFVGMQGSVLVSQHIIYMAALLVLVSFRAGKVWGLEKLFLNSSFFYKYPKLRNLFD